MSDRRRDRDQDEKDEFRFKERHGWRNGARIRPPGVPYRDRPAKEKRQ